MDQDAVPGCSSKDFEVNIDNDVEPETSRHPIIEGEQDDNEIDKELLALIDSDAYIQKGQKMISYEKQLFLDMLYSDGLVVVGKGISYERVFLNLLKVYCDSGNLVLILNSDDYEEKLYTKLLNSDNVHQSSTNGNDREKVYLEGGVQFISTRILVVDLLKERIPIPLITGIFVLRAHQIIESCQEAFALRLYRQKNKTGFIKAFSTSAEAFTYGFGHVERVMRNLFVRELFLWPRFHALIQKDLKPYEPTSVEFHIPMTTKMTLIQTHILDLMNFQVKELKRVNRYVDLEEVTVENCVTKKFQKILQSQLDVIWHQLSAKTKLLITDLKVLRSLMFATIYSDAVTMYAITKKYRTTEYALSNSGWTMLNSAEQIFKLAKERVFNAQDEFIPEPSPKWKALSEILTVEIPTDIKALIKDRNAKFNRNEPVKILILCSDARTCYQLNQYLVQGEERCLFYSAMKNNIPIQKLSDKYKRIQSIGAIKDMQVKGVTAYNSKPKEVSEGPGPAPKQREQIPLVIKTLKKNKKSAEDSLLNEANESGCEQDSKTKEDNFSFDDDPDECFKDSYILTMTQKLGDGNEMDAGDFDVTRSNDVTFELCSQELDDLDITSFISAFEKPMIFIQTFKSDHKRISTLDKTLEEMRPNYIVLYNCNVTAIRQIEIYEGRLQREPKQRMKAFVLLHSKTVEEQAYLTSLRREKQAFEHLIKTKSTMVVPEYQDGKSEDSLPMLQKTIVEVSTRQAGGQDPVPSTSMTTSDGVVKTITPKVIVDIREFRSELPCMIHKRGIEVVPFFITIGDYILTPDICVERKSISDLIGSLNSGRLYNQCIQMGRFYSKPILLIEFDQNRPFHLQGHFMLSTDAGTSNADIVQKLQLLTIHFPKLRIVWSPSPYATAQLFEELKMNKEEPNPEMAIQLGSEDPSQDFDLISEKYNTNIHDFLLKLPGITSKNIDAVMRKGKSFKDLLKLTEVELGELLDNSKNGKDLWEIMHVMHKPMLEKESEKSGFSKYKSARGAGGHRKF